MKTIVTTLLGAIALMGLATSSYAGNCTSCGGTGFKKVNATDSQRCAVCNGTGNVGQPGLCSMCNGKKTIKVNDKETKTCPKCGGSGKS